MLRFDIRIDNPWHRQKDGVGLQEGFVRTWRLSKNKSLEIQLDRWNRGIAALIELEIDARWRGHDHAGFRLYTDILGFFACLQMYDHRHWDYENGCWASYDC